MRINNNSAIINNNCVKFQHLILFFIFPMGTRKNFFEIYRQFGHASLKRFASPVTDDEYAAGRGLKESWNFDVVCTAHHVALC